MEFMGGRMDVAELKKLEVLASAEDILATEQAQALEGADGRITVRDWSARVGLPPALSEGSVVCFTNDDGLPLKVARAQGQDYWELVPTTLSPHLQPECVFTVVKRGDLFGFRSWGAQGRMLQDTKNSRRKNEPPRVSNYNFFSWESWRAAGNALQNCAWKTDFPWNISELRVQVVSLLHESELKQRNEHRELRRALLMTEEKREEMEGHLKQAIQTCQKQMEFASQQTDELQSRLAENLARNECLSTEVLECQELNKQSQATIARLSRDLGVVETREIDASKRVASLESQLREEQLQAKAKVKKVTAKLTGENKKLRKQMESRLREVEEENEGLRKALDSIASKISQFSARNSPAVAAKVKPVEEMLEAALSSPCSVADSVESSDSVLLADPEDYAVDETLPGAIIAEEPAMAEAEEDAKHDVTEEFDDSIEIGALLEDPASVVDSESPVKSDLIDLDSPLFSATNCVDSYIEAEDVGSSPKSEPSGFTASVSGMNLLSVQDSLTCEEVSGPERSDVIFSPGKEDEMACESQDQADEEDQAAAEETDGSEGVAVHPLQERELNIPEEAAEVAGADIPAMKAKAKEMGFEGNGFAAARKTLGGGKRVTGFKPSEMDEMFGETDMQGKLPLGRMSHDLKVEADYESEDWWNSFTMESSLSH